MGREVLVNPHIVDQNINDMQSAISDLKSVIEMDRNKGANEKLTSIVKLHKIISDFEEVLTSYTALAELDNTQVTLIKEKLIEEDNRIVDLRIFK